MPSLLERRASSEDIKVKFRTVIPQVLSSRSLAKADSLGAVFRLTEDALISKLEKLVSAHPDTFALRETAGIFQFYKLAEIKADKLLETYYQKNINTKVA